MTSPESPTHPDAPRAGGETPDLLPCPFCGETRVRAYCTGGWWCIRCTQRKCQAHAYPFAETEADAVAAWNRRASLLERHRDGERAEPDAWLVVIHVRRGGSNTTARYFYSERETAEREADRKCNAIGDSFAQIFPLFAASPDAAGSASPDPERASK